jgi:hypothetical protein
VIVLGEDSLWRRGAAVDQTRRAERRGISPLEAQEVQQILAATAPCRGWTRPVASGGSKLEGEEASCCSPHLRRACPVFADPALVEAPIPAKRRRHDDPSVLSSSLSSRALAKKQSHGAKTDGGQARESLLLGGDR